MISALAGLRNLNVPPEPTPFLPLQITAAQMAINYSANAYQTKMQLGLLNAYSDPNNVLTSLLQQQVQQISLLTQLEQYEQQTARLNSLSSLRRNFPP